VALWFRARDRRRLLALWRWAVVLRALVPWVLVLRALE
jgi:hypothetical protein